MPLEKSVAHPFTIQQYPHFISPVTTGILFIINKPTNSDSGHVCILNTYTQ